MDNTTGDNNLTTRYDSRTSQSGQNALLTTGSTTMYPYYAYYPYDRGAKVFRLVQILRDAKYMKIESVDKFIEIMDLLIKEL